MTAALDAAKDKALFTAREIRSVLSELERFYHPDSDPQMRWIYGHQRVLDSWINTLRQAEADASLGAMWRQVQSISRLLGSVLNDDLTKKYMRLQERFYQEMTSVVAEERRLA